jgi:hypothetical protein
MRIRATDDLIEPAVTNTIDNLELRPQDHAAAELARHYAAAIDNSDDPQAALDRLGPKLLAALEQLGATPKARAAITKRTPSNAATNRLEQLRAARGS